MRYIKFLSIFLIFFSHTTFADVRKIAKEFEAGNLEKALILANHHQYSDIHKFLQTQKFFDKNNTSFEAITSFLKKNPNWPQRNSLVAIAESKLTDSTSKSSILQWFNHNKPISSKGYYYFYKAAIEREKDEKKLRKVISDAWIYGNITAEAAEKFLAKHKKFLTTEDHVLKTAELIWNGQIKEAEKTSKLTDKNYQIAFKAAIDIKSSGKKSENEFHKVKGSYRYISVLLYNYLKLHMKSDLNPELITLLGKIPEDQVHAKDWWKLRNYYARELLALKKYQEAYKLTSNHGLIEPSDIVEAEWIAGFISFRLLNKPEIAKDHFHKIYNLSKSSISKARGAYWLGRSLAASGKKDEAKNWFEKGANYGYTYYGQLSQYELGLKNLKLPSDPGIQKSDHKNFRENKYAEIVEFLSYSSKFEIMKLFAKEAFFTAKSDGEVDLIFQKVKANLNTHKKTEIAKLAQQAGVLLLDYAYPTPYKLPKNFKEKNLAYAIMRQESVFDYTAISTANAMGLMQLVAPTAKAMAKDLGIKCDVKKLTTNPEYNIKLGTHYLEYLLERNDSYIKIAAHYNAGPPADKWDILNGDPKQMKLYKVIDWIELIPYYETRNYVQRIIENMQIYNYILSGSTKIKVKDYLMR